MQSAITQDQAAIEVDNDLEIIDTEYVDSTGANSENAEPDKIDVPKEVKSKRKTQPKQEEIDLDVPKDLQDK